MDSGPKVFQASQSRQKTVIHIRNCGVPMKRANFSVALPKASGFGVNRGSSRARASRGVSSPPVLVLASATASPSSHGLRRLIFLGPPVVGQQLVQYVVDGHRAD